MLKSIVIALIATAILLLFIVSAFMSEILRTVIVWLEPKLHIILLSLAIAIAICAATLKQLNKTESSKNTEKHNKRIKFFLGSISKVKHWFDRISCACKIERYRQKLRLVFAALLPALAVIAFTLPLFQTWTTGNTNDFNSFGGLIPSMDSGCYYIGAEHLLFTGELDSWNYRRPINSSLLAVRLALAKHDFRTAMLIQAVLLGLSCYLATKTFTMDFGAIPGLAFFGILIALGRTYAATTMSESLGLTFGALAFAVMWYGLRKQRDWMIASGFILLMSGLSARIGAIIILPCLLVWACFALRRTKTARYVVAGFIISAIVIGFFLNLMVFKLNGGGDISQFQGGSALTLYGFAVGGKGWRQASNDFPETRLMDDATRNAFVYRKTFELIKNEPSRFIMSVAKGSAISLMEFSVHITERISGILPYATPIKGQLTSNLLVRLIAMMLLFILVCVGIVRFFLINRRDLRVSFIMSGLLGNILSVPLVFPDGFLRVFAVTFPFFAATISVGITLWYSSLRHRLTYAENNHKVFIPLALGMVLIIAALFGPNIVRQFAYIPFPKIPPYESDKPSIVAYVGPGSTYLDILHSSSLTKTFAPKINECDFKASLDNITDPNLDEFKHIYQNISAPAVLLYVYDLKSEKEVSIWAPPGVIGEEWNYVQFNVQRMPAPSNFLKVIDYSVISPDS
jgi:hypothetical protein